MKESSNFKVIKNLRCREILYSIVIGLIIGIVILYYFKVSKVVGTSMEPTLCDGETVIIDVTYEKMNNLAYGDIIIFSKRSVSDDYFVKRVIGTPGDEIKIVKSESYKSNLYINGFIKEESFIKEDMVGKNFEIIVPEGYLFVMGDNRNRSTDSRESYIGLVNVDEDIYGKAIFNMSRFKGIE